MSHERLTAFGAQPMNARSPSPLKSLWRSVRKPLARSTLVKRGLVELITGAVRVVAATNPRVAQSDDPVAFAQGHMPVIVTMWHGQHLLLPAMVPRAIPLVALFSRSSDAEMNAEVARRFGLGVVRGSGGREREKSVEKGGARALLALKKALSDGKSVAMIADIPHGTPREAGLGIVTLARISGRPIMPVALATSRRKVLERSWDKTALNLPFGRSAFAVGPMITVPAEASDVELADYASQVTRALNDATRRAYAMTDGPR